MDVHAHTQTFIYTYVNLRFQKLGGMTSFSCNYTHGHTHIHTYIHICKPALSGTKLGRMTSFSCYYTYGHTLRERVIHICKPAFSGTKLGGMTSFSCTTSPGSSSGTAIHWSQLLMVPSPPMLQCVAVCCSVLQCVAVHPRCQLYTGPSC